LLWVKQARDTLQGIGQVSAVAMTGTLRPVRTSCLFALTAR